MNKINHNKCLEFYTLSRTNADVTSDARGCEDLLLQSPVHASHAVERRRISPTYYHRDSQNLGAPSIVISGAPFLGGIGAHILGGELPTPTSTSNMVLIDVSPFTNTCGLKH